MKKLFAILAVSLGLSAPALAIDVDLGPLGVDDPTPFAELHLPGTFNDTFSFSVSKEVFAGFSVTDFGPFDKFNTILLSMALVSNPDGKIFSGDDKLVKVGTPVNDTLSLLALLKPGNYYLDVAGLAIGDSGGVYQGSGLISVVPEPASLATFGAGLIGLGLYLRRRRVGPEDDPADDEQREEPTD